LKRILLTGASGFIGRHCTASLRSRGYEVHAVTSASPPEAPEGVRWHRVDLLDPAQIGAVVGAVEPTHLLHLAWYVAPGSFISSPANLAWVQASLELLRQFSEHGGQRVVMAGSGYEYDWTAEQPCTEAHTPTIPNTFYGVCKQALCELVTAYSGVAGISSAWGRIFFLYGPHEHPDRLVSSIIRSLLRGEPARCSHGRQIRDYLYVGDVASALVALLDSEVQGPVNIASGRPIALKDLATTIGERLRRPELIALGAIPARANDAPVVVADTTRLNLEVGWQPSYDLEAGLGETIRWWAEQLTTGAREER
jgi:nucleoside-diphosphate-sugar epimerase